MADQMTELALGVLHTFSDSCWRGHVIHSRHCNAEATEPVRVFRQLSPLEEGQRRIEGTVEGSLSRITRVSKSGIADNLLQIGGGLETLVATIRE